MISVDLFENKVSLNREKFNLITRLKYRRRTVRKYVFFCPNLITQEIIINRIKMRPTKQ